LEIPKNKLSGTKASKIKIIKIYGINKTYRKPLSRK